MNVISHDWNIRLTEAKQIQKSLAKKVKQRVIQKSIRIIAGFDNTYHRTENISIAGMVVLAYPSLRIIDKVVHEQPVSFPYIPGYLSFREAPALMSLITSYIKPVDVLIFDGHGLAHPRGLGIASHIGVLTGRSTIGCAKKKLVGEYELPGNDKGNSSELVYKENVIGRVLRTKTNVKPVFISAGHMITLDQACEIILNCSGGYRIPEPTRLAHHLVSSYR